MENVVNLRAASVMFKSILCKEIGIVGPDEVNAVTQFSLRELNGEPTLYVEYVMPSEENPEDMIPMERHIVAADEDVSPVLFFKNLQLLTKLMENVNMSVGWKEAFIIRLTNVLAYQEFVHVPKADAAAIEAEMQRHDSEEPDAELLGEDEVVESAIDVVVFDAAEIPRYNMHGFITNEELMVATPVEVGSDGTPHYIRAFPVVMFGSCIAINQHIGVEILSRPRLNVDEDYENMRTGRLMWHTNGFATIIDMPSYDEVALKEIPGRGIGDDGVEYELSIAGCRPINIM